MKFGGGPSPGGSIRNTLGSGLKNSGFFQKDGQINNLRGGFIGPKNSPYPQGMYPQQVPYGYGQPGGMPQISGPGAGRQLILQAAQQGIFGNGVATISPDNSFSLVANLPQPSSFVGQGAATYAAYLVDNKGKTGFLAGIMRPIGNGMYQVNFRSQVPLTHYDKVVVSVESPNQIGHAPSGPIILKVKEPRGPAAFINPIKNVGGSIWSKISGLFQGRGKAPVGNPIAPVNPAEPGVPAAPAPITGPVAPVSSPVVPVPIQQAPEISPDLISSLNQMNVKIPNTSGVGANPQGPFANPK